MKKIVRTLCLVAMVALVATSCKKKEEGTTVTVAFEETKGFEAGPSFDGSKPYLDPNDSYKFKWCENDSIAYYNLAKGNNWGQSTCSILTAVKGSQGKTKTQFTGEVGAMLDGYFVFYNPKKAAGAQSGHTQGVGNREVFTVPATQTYNPTYLMDPKALVMACQSPEVGVFTLQHIFGFLNIGIGHNKPANGQVEYIRVTDTRHITGELELKLDEVNPETFGSLISQLEQVGENDPEYQQALGDYLHVLGYNAHQNTLGNTITLNCNNANLITNNYRYFFIALRPGALYKGFDVTIHYTNNTEFTHHFEGMSYLIKPGTFTNIYALSSGHWYIGDSWVLD